jgi:hypothetical protein
MMLLEPSTDNALNTEASSSYQSDPISLEQQVQMTLEGGIYRGITFPRVAGSNCAYCRNRLVAASYSGGIGNITSVPGIHGSVPVLPPPAAGVSGSHNNSFSSNWKELTRQSSAASSINNGSSSPVPRELLRRKRSEDFESSSNSGGDDGMQCTENEADSISGSDQLFNKAHAIGMANRQLGSRSREEAASVSAAAAVAVDFVSSSKRMKLDMHEEFAAAHMFNSLSIQKDVTGAVRR